MSDMELYQAGGNRGVSRQIGRTLARINGGTSVAVAQVEARADIQTAQIDAIVAVGQRALQGTALLSQMEGQLGQIVPLAVSRLQAVGDISALAMAQVVSDTATKLRRL